MIGDPSGKSAERNLLSKQELDKNIIVLSNKARFIKEQCDNTIDLRRKKIDIVNKLLSDRGYDLMDDSYKYLINMPISSLIEENIKKLLSEKQTKENQKELLLKTSIEKLWTDELVELNNYYKYYLKARISRNNHKSAKKKKV